MRDHSQDGQSIFDRRLPNIPEDPGLLPEDPRVGQLLRELQRLRTAGTDLANAAIYVGTHYDGLHRLMSAAAKWVETLATEFGRPESTKVEEGDHSEL